MINPVAPTCDKAGGSLRDNLGRLGKEIRKRLLAIDAALPNGFTRVGTFSSDQIDAVSASSFWALQSHLFSSPLRSRCRKLPACRGAGSQLTTNDGAATKATKSEGRRTVSRQAAKAQWNAPAEPRTAEIDCRISAYDRGETQSVDFQTSLERIRPAITGTTNAAGPCFPTLTGVADSSVQGGTRRPSRQA